MKKRFLIALSALFCSIFANAKSNQLYQVSNIGILAQGVFSGTTTYGEVKKNGNFGLGTFNGLDGEMVAIDGKFYQFLGDGQVNKVADSQLTPFAEVTYFKPEITFELSNLNNYQDLQKELLSHIPNKNLPYAIRIDGDFSDFTFRTISKFSPPYPTLDIAAKKQVLHEVTDVSGSLVGFYFPSYWGNTGGVVGFHLHFISNDRKTGGHVFEVAINNAKVSLAAMSNIEITLPNTNKVANVDLDDKSIADKIDNSER